MSLGIAGRLVAASIALCGGAAYASAFAAPGAAHFALPALCVLAWQCVHAATPRHAAWSGFLWGLPAFGGGLAWLHHALHDLGGTSLAITLPVMVFIVVVLAGYVAGAAWLATRIGITKGARASAFAGTWFVAEYTRSHVFIGFPWMLAGDSQLDLPLGMLAPWTGVYGVGFALAGVASLAAWLLPRRRITAAGLVLVASLPSTPTITNAGSQEDAWRVTALRLPAEQAPGGDAAWAWYRDRTFALGADHDLVAWPEHVAPVHAHELRDDIVALSLHAASQGWPLLFGLPVQEHGGRSFNAMLAVGDGHGRYDKRALVPFVEHTPYRLLIGRTLTLIENKIAGFTPGAPRAPMVANGRTLASAICYEAAFPEVVRENLRAAGEPALLLLPSSDRWYSDGAGARQIQRMARMRARENGIAAVRVATEGTSLFIDRDGRVTASLDAQGDALLTGTVAIGQAVTPWSRFGMAPTWLGFALALGIACALRRVSRPTSHN
ncbi:apolipoprotein N-acyltransferase [Lysobacter sp. A6]|uniref:Apolipoprotein N-acyltransferase n=1 Tax=Noviluteimonas lactosilytica TaxID=2888523 RepID=A0ABS8JGJ3_9GAMM|nr:apolipoprotein N-acyltransferase [Lysobacter lactosilyticus]